MLTACGGNATEGEWVEPVPDMENQVQGFDLKAGGKASSINMATLQYENWSKDGNMLILSGKSIGNHTTISFSKTPAPVKVSPKATPPATSKPKETGSGLKAGQSVVQSAYGEFAVTSDEEISALKQSANSASDALHVDLHIEAIPGGRSIPKGQQLQFQMEAFRKVIRENLHHRGRTITFIHGIGDGILKAAIRKELDEVLALRCSYSIGDPAVTAVTIL